MKARTRLHRIDSPLARTAAHTMVVLLALFGGAHDMHAATRIDTTRRSDQFVIHDARKYGRSLAAFADSENPRLVQLEPDPLLMSAERIKEALLHELRLPARGGAAIHCYLYAPVRNNENILLVSTLHSDGWQYSLQVPDDLDRTKLVSGIVQVVLLEFANHGTAQKSAEIPAWLVEGLTKQLLAKVGTELVVDSVPANALRRTVRELRGADSLAEARQYLRTHRALSFSELSQPLPAVASDETMRLYRISAQLLIAELLYIPDGPVRLARMLRELPNCWNWQTAFLQAFGFQRLLDAEKWWSVAATTFMGRDPTLFAPKESCLARLDEIMRASANVRVSTNALPVRAEATLLQVISEWDYLTQRVVLQQKLVQLIMLRASAPVSIVDLIDAYRECLRAYLQKRDLSGYAPENKRQVRIPGPLLAREAVRQLQMLDERRAALRQEIGSAPGVAVSGAP